MGRIQHEKGREKKRGVETEKLRGKKKKRKILRVDATEIHHGKGRD